MERALKPEEEEELSAEAKLEALLEKKAAKSGSSGKNKGKDNGDGALLALDDKSTNIRPGSPGSSGANTPSKGTQLMLRLTGQVRETEGSCIRQLHAAAPLPSALFVRTSLVHEGGR